MPCLNIGCLKKLSSICIHQQGKLRTCSYHVPSKSALGKLWTCSHTVPSKSSLGQPDDCAKSIHPITLGKLMTPIQTAAACEFSVPVPQQRQFRQQKLKLNTDFGLKSDLHVLNQPHSVQSWFYSWHVVWADSLILNLCTCII